MNNPSLTTITFITTSSLLLIITIGVVLFTTRAFQRHEIEEIKRKQKQFELENETKRLQQQVATLISRANNDVKENEEEQQHKPKSNNGVKRKEIETWNNIQVKEWIISTLKGAGINQELSDATGLLFMTIDGKQFVDLIVNDAHHLSLNDRLFFLGCDSSIIQILAASAEQLVI